MANTIINFTPMTNALNTSPPNITVNTKGQDQNGINFADKLCLASVGSLAISYSVIPCVT